MPDSLRRSDSSFAKSILKSLMKRKNPGLKNRLRASLRGAERIAVLGVGSELRGDDAAGLGVGDYQRDLPGAGRTTAGAGE